MSKFSDLSRCLYTYFSGFLPAYVEGGVPSHAKFPYCTYTISLDEEYGDSLIQVRVWSNSTSLAQVSRVADKIEMDIGKGKTIPCGDGTLWLKAGTPFQQFVPDEEIDIKSIYINIVTNYLV